MKLFICKNKKLINSENADTNNDLIEIYFTLIINNSKKNLKPNCQRIKDFKK